MRTIKSTIIAIITLLVSVTSMAAEPLNADSLKLVGMEKISKPAPPQMLTIIVANFQVELCGIPATDTTPLQLVRKELCSK